MDSQSPVAIFPTESGPRQWIFLPQQTLANDCSLQTKWTLLLRWICVSSMGLWSLGFYDSLSFVSVNWPPVSPPRYCWIQTTLVYPHLIQMLFFSLVLFRQCLRAGRQAGWQAQGQAGVRSLFWVVSLCSGGHLPPWGQALCWGHRDTGAGTECGSPINEEPEEDRNRPALTQQAAWVASVSQNHGATKLTHIFEFLDNRRSPFLYAIFLT